MDCRFRGKYVPFGGVRTISSTDLRHGTAKDKASLRQVLLGHLSDTKEPLKHSMEEWGFSLADASGVPLSAVAKADQKSPEALADAAMAEIETNDQISITYVAFRAQGPTGFDLAAFARWWEMRSGRPERERERLALKKGRKGKPKVVKALRVVPGEVNGRLPKYMK